MKIHELKTHPEHFYSVVRGSKTFEIRKNDRGFQSGDILKLKEYPHMDNNVTPFTYVKVTHILHSFEGLDPDYCVMSIKLATREEVSELS